MDPNGALPSECESDYFLWSLPPLNTLVCVHLGPILRESQGDKDQRKTDKHQRIISLSRRLGVNVPLAIDKFTLCRGSNYVELWWSYQTELICINSSFKHCLRSSEHEMWRHPILFDRLVIVAMTCYSLVCATYTVVVAYNNLVWCHLVGHTITLHDYSPEFCDHIPLCAPSIDLMLDFRLSQSSTLAQRLKWPF